MIMCEADKIAESLFSVKGTVHCEQCQKVVIEAAKICAEAGKKRLFNILADKAICYCLDGDGYASEKVWAANTAEELGLKKRAAELYKSAVEGFIKDLREGGLSQAFNAGESFYFIPDVMVNIANSLGMRGRLLRTALRAYRLAIKEVKSEEERKDFSGIIRQLKRMMKD